MNAYRELDSVRIPEDVEELGVVAGDSGVIVNISAGEVEGRRGTWRCGRMVPWLSWDTGRFPESLRTYPYRGGGNAGEIPFIRTSKLILSHENPF